MNLSELIMTRVSHDLSGIAGALFNTAELLELDPTFAIESGGVLKETTSHLLARLRLFRTLFGLETKEITSKLAVDYFKTLSAPIELVGSVDNRIQLIAVIVAAETLIRGGTITVNETKTIAIGQIHIDSGTKSVLEGQTQNASSRQAILLWLQSYATQQNLSLSILSQDNQFEIRY